MQKEISRSPFSETAASLPLELVRRGLITEWVRSP